MGIGKKLSKKFKKIFFNGSTNSSNEENMRTPLMEMEESFFNDSAGSSNNEQITQSTVNERCAEGEPIYRSPSKSRDEGRERAEQVHADLLQNCLSIRGAERAAVCGARRTNRSGDHHGPVLDEWRQARRPLGQVGSLPDIFVELEVNFYLLRRLLGVRTKVSEKQEKVSKLAKQEMLMLNIGSMSTGGRVIAVKNDLAKLQLTTPVCTSRGEKIALSRRVEKHWRLIGWGQIQAGAVLDCPPCPAELVQS